MQTRSTASTRRAKLILGGAGASNCDTYLGLMVYGRLRSWSLATPIKTWWTITDMRKEFVFPKLLSSANWFPGHMARGLRVMNRRLQDCDCVLEIHDARMVSRRPKILVLNKVDMADASRSEEVMKLLRQQGEREIVFTNCRTQHHHSTEELMTRIKSVVGFDAEEEEMRPASIKLMLMGIPNVGKSSIINALRRWYLKKGKATRVGALPGVTRGVLGRIMVSDDPKMSILDTPGVMVPNISSTEVALKLALVGTLRDHFIGERVIVDYLLYMLNRSKLYRYVDFYDLPEPCDDIESVLDSVSRRIGALTKGGIYDYQRAATHFLRMYRDGQLGVMTLDL